MERFTWSFVVVSAGCGGVPLAPPVADEELARVVVGAEPVPSPGCGTSTTRPGSSSGVVEYADGDRSYLLEVPRAHDGSSPLALVVDLHGTFATAGAQRLLSGVQGAARTDGFVAVWPDSEVHAGLKAWLLLCDSGDVTFVSDLIDQLGEELCIDESRVIVTGISNGAYLASVLGSVLTDQVSAIAPVAGGPGFVPGFCPATTPLPVTIVHGTADPVVPFSEGEALQDYWSSVGGCAEPTTDEEGCEVAECAEGTTVRFCAAEGVGHVNAYAAYPTLDRIRDLVEATGG